MFNGTNVKLFKPFKLQVVEVTGRSLLTPCPYRSAVEVQTMNRVVDLRIVPAPIRLRAAGESS
jgi:hypothetical protein